MVHQGLLAPQRLLVFPRGGSNVKDDNFVECFPHLFVSISVADLEGVRGVLEPFTGTRLFQFHGRI